MGERPTGQEHGRVTVADHEALSGLIRHKIVGEHHLDAAAKIGVGQAAFSRWSRREDRPDLMSELDNILEGGRMTGTGAQALRLLRTVKRTD